MHKRWVVLAVAIFTSLFSAMFIKSPAECCGKTLQLEKLERPTYQVLYVRVPASPEYNVIPVFSDKLETLPNLVNKVKSAAIAGINAGFFDPNNKQTTSYVITDGKIALNPVDNRNFVENPTLYPYIVKMLNRSEFRVLECGGKRKYDIAKRRDPLGFRCNILHGMQAGPNLFEPGSEEEEAFIAVKDNQRIRDPLGIDRKNARSAIGIDEAGNVILAMASMIPGKETPTGVTLREMRQVMRELGAQKALSLDGGSSSSLWVSGESYYGKLDKAFNPVVRPIKSALVVVRED